MNVNQANDSVSVVVSTWNGKRATNSPPAWSALERQTLPPREVIVVIDHNPELLELGARRFPRVRAVENRHERGVVGARNTGIEVAQGDWWSPSPTTTPTPSRPGSRSSSPASPTPAVVGVTGELLPRWSGTEPRWFPHEFYWVFGCSYTGLPTELAPVRNPIGANMAVRGAALEEVGGFRQAACAPRADPLPGRRGRRRPRARRHRPRDPHRPQVARDAAGSTSRDATVFHRSTRSRQRSATSLRRSFEEGAARRARAGSRPRAGPRARSGATSRS